MKIKTETTTETKVITETIITEVYCDNCCSLLKSVFTDADGRPYRNPTQCLNALHIDLHGGYGMYFDNDDKSLLFCEICADKLLEAFPGFKDVFK